LLKGVPHTGLASIIVDNETLSDNDSRTHNSYDSAAKTNPIGEVEFLKTLLDQLFESEVAETVLPALCTALLSRPEFIPSVPAVIGDISTRADPSPLIRFMSYTCTLDDIVLLTRKPVFQSVLVQVMRLFRDSLKWKVTPQLSFWVIVRRAYLYRPFNPLIIDAFQSLLKPLSEGQVSSFHMRQLLTKTVPSSALAPLVFTMMRELDAACLMLVAMLETWCEFYRDDTELFVQLRANAFRAFYEDLPPLTKPRFPQIIKDLLFPPSETPSP
jgi:hypothetical protein